MLMMRAHLLQFCKGKRRVVTARLLTSAGCQPWPSDADDAGLGLPSVKIIRLSSCAEKRANDLC